MKYIENEIVELKSTLTEDTKNEIVAFLNSYLGGTIYIGVDNLGNIVKFSQKEKDFIESKIINWIRDEAIYPNCSEFISIHYNKDDVLTISINPGTNKPYYLKEKGPKPSGVYVRYGRNKSQATHEEITRMIMNSSNIFYEELISKNQNLTFNTLKLKFEEKNIEYNKFKMITSGFIKGNKFTNLAYIFSDQYDIETKIGVYFGLDRSTFKSKKEFSGSIISQIDKTLEYCDICNETRIIIDGSPMRKEYNSYIKLALREAILNCFCHRDYNKRSNIKIEYFDNRCEIISPGGFYGGLTIEEALSGVQSFRNKYLVQLLHKLGYIENYSSGLNRIISEYEKYNIIPIIESSLNMFKITFPNINYHLDNITVNELSYYIKDNVADVANKIENVADNVADVANKIENVADNVVDVANKFENVADNVADVANKFENVADNVVDVANKFENVADNVVDVANKFENVADNVADIANKFENVADNVADVANKIENVADNVVDVANKFENVADNVADVANKYENVADNVADVANESLEKILIAAIRKNNKISRKDLARLINKSSKTIERLLKNNKRIIRVGSTKSGHWEIIEDEKTNND